MHLCLRGQARHGHALQTSKAPRKTCMQSPWISWVWKDPPLEPNDAQPQKEHLCAATELALNPQAHVSLTSVAWHSHIRHPDLCFISLHGSTVLRFPCDDRVWPRPQQTSRCVMEAGCTSHPVGGLSAGQLSLVLQSAGTEGSLGRPCRPNLGRRASETGARGPWGWQGGISGPA